MTIAGWITMLVSLTVVWVGTFWCFSKVLKSPKKEETPVGLGP